MDIQQLRHFLAVVETRNIMRASVAMHISQSGLSRSLSALEASVGVPLLTRKPNGVEPTAFGRQLAKHARVIMKEVKDAIGEISAIKHGWARELAVGITPSYSQHTLPDVLAELLSKQPGLSIVVRTASSSALKQMVQEGELDVAFGVFGALDLEPDLVMTSLARAQPQVIAGPDHPLSKRKKVSVQDLAEAKWVLMDGPNLLLAFSMFFNSHGHETPRQAVKTNSISIAKTMVRLTHSLTIASPDCILDDVASGRLVVLDCPAPAPQAQVGLFHRAAALPNKPLEEFISIMKGRLVSDV